MLRHLPNLLSGLRLGLAPLAAWAVLEGDDTLAFGVFLTAGVSDLLDGLAARRWGFTSRFGAWLDPAADKLLILLCLMALLEVGAVPFWLVLLVLARDAAVAAGALSAWALSLSPGAVPLTIGKATMALEVGYVAAVLLLLAMGWTAPRLMLAGAATVAVFVFLSAAAYGHQFLRTLLFGRRTA